MCLLDTSLYDKFSTSSLVVTINVGSSGDNAFDCITLPNKTELYYATDSSGVFIYDEDWNFKFKINLALSGLRSYIKPVNNELFTSNTKRLIKTDLNLNIIQEITKSLNSYPRGITHDDSCNDLILHAIMSNSASDNKIDIYNRNLTLVDSIPVALTYRPYSLFYYVNKIFVGNNANGSVLVIQNKSISQVWTTPCVYVTTNTITSINIDQYGYIMVSCYSQNQLFLLYKNGTYTGKSLKTTYLPTFASVDQKGRIIVNGGGKLQLFF
jgi:hypothetical protein